MIGYIGLVYAFVGDIFVLDEAFYPLELIGVGIVLILNVVMIVYNLKKDAKKEKLAIEHAKEQLLKKPEDRESMQYSTINITNDNAEESAQ